MDRRTIVAIFLALAAYYLWMVWVATNPVLEVELPPDAPVASAPPPAPVLTAPTVPPPEELPVRELPFRGCGIEAAWSTEGGVMHSTILPQYQAPTDVTPIWQWALSGFSGPWRPYGGDTGPETLVSADGALLAVGTGDLATASPRVRVIEESPSRVVMAGLTADGVEVTRTIQAIGTDPCVLDIEVSWRNASPSAFTGGLWVASHDVMDADAGQYENAIRPYAMIDGGVDTRTNIAKMVEPEPVAGDVQWFGLADRYFAALLLPDAASQGTLVFSPRQLGSQVGYGEHYVVTRALVPGETHTEHFRMYVGPKAWEAMNAVDPTLAEFVDWEYGWFAAVCYPLLWLLRLFEGLVGNWGLAIILLTVAMKGVFFPLTQTAFRSSQAMQAIQPKMQALRETYKDSPEELNRRTIEMFREHGVNPLGGCLPMIVQMPVWFALYRVLLSSVELYHTNFLFLDDLSVLDPYAVLPVVVVALMVVQQQMMPTGNMDPTQARIMKFMPLIFGFFFFAFPAGLVLYIFVNMVLTILQQWLIKRQFENLVPAAAATS